MKKRTLCLLLSLIMLWGCAMALSSCGEQEDNTTAITTSRKEASYNWGYNYIVVCDKLPYELVEKSFSKRFSRYEEAKFENSLAKGTWMDSCQPYECDYYIIYKRNIIYEYVTSVTANGGGILNDRTNGRSMILFADDTILFESFLGIKSLESLYEK